MARRPPCFGLSAREGRKGGVGGVGHRGLGLVVQVGEAQSGAQRDVDPRRPPQPLLPQVQLAPQRPLPPPAPPAPQEADTRVGVFPKEMCPSSVPIA